MERFRRPREADRSAERTPARSYREGSNEARIGTGESARQGGKTRWSDVVGNRVLGAWEREDHPALSSLRGGGNVPRR